MYLVSDQNCPKRYQPSGYSPSELSPGKILLRQTTDFAKLLSKEVILTVKPEVGKYAHKANNSRSGTFVNLAASNILGHSSNNILQM
jgi:hypothetical protein